MIRRIPIHFVIAFSRCFMSVLLVASADADSSSCQVSLALGLQIVPPPSSTTRIGSTACPCGSDTCGSSELCYVFPQDETNTDFENWNPWDTTNQCYKVPCDDVSGDWILYDGSSNDNSDVVVLGTVSIQQSACHTPILTLTNGNGTVTTYYALLSWREIYMLYLFTSLEERDDYANLSFQELDNGPPATRAFIQDFGNGAPLQQCVYFGSFVDFVGEGSSLAILGRNIDKKWSVGGVLSADEVPSNQNCPAGYPKAWNQADGTTLTSSAVVTPSHNHNRVVVVMLTIMAIVAF